MTMCVTGTHVPALGIESNVGTDVYKTEQGSQWALLVLSGCYNKEP